MAVDSVSPRQEEFLLEYIRNGGNAAAAYGKVIAKPGGKTANHRIAASQLLRNPNVANRLRELREQMADKNSITAETIAQQLDEDRKFAREQGQAAAAVKATEAKARLFGLDKNETSLSIRPDDAREIIARFLAKYAADLPAKREALQ